MCSGGVTRRPSGLPLTSSPSHGAWSLSRRAFWAFVPVYAPLLPLLALLCAVDVQLHGLSLRVSGSGSWLVLRSGRSLRRRLGGPGPLSLRLLRGLLLCLSPLLSCRGFSPVGLSPLLLGSLSALFPRPRRVRLLLPHSYLCPLMRLELRLPLPVSPALFGASRRTKAWPAVSGTREGVLLRDRLLCSLLGSFGGSFRRSGPLGWLGSCSFGAQSRSPGLG